MAPRQRLLDALLLSHQPVQRRVKLLLVDRPEREHTHRHAHRQRALGDRVGGAGESHVGVLRLARGRVARDLGVVRVSVL